MHYIVSNLFLGGVFDSWAASDYKLVAAFVHNTSTNWNYKNKGE